MCSNFYDYEVYEEHTSAPLGENHYLYIFATFLNQLWILDIFFCHSEQLSLHFFWKKYLRFINLRTIDTLIGITFASLDGLCPLVCPSMSYFEFCAPTYSDFLEYIYSYVLQFFNDKSASRNIYILYFGRLFLQV